ncbi:MAG: hypothetical protein EBY34_04950, partial [Alphaproteobacteria bacterium]|nr:hypothetical protein [Alphaproteobacteria bacterium]
MRIFTGASLCLMLGLAGLLSNVATAPAMANEAAMATGIIELRPDDADHVKLGQKIYLEQCASCHGV